MSYAARMADEPEKPTTGEPLDLEPMERDRSFVFRLVALIVIGLIAVAFVASKMKSAAAGCGSGLVRPGSSVVPPQNPAN